MVRLLLGAFSIFVITNSQALAQEVRITPDTSSYTIELNGQTITIGRVQDAGNTIAPEFQKTSRPCPPFCIHPMSAGDGVQTVGELEVIDFLEKKVAAGSGLLIDSRVPEWFVKGTIPGAVNVPFTTLEPTNPYRDQILQALGATRAGTGWDFSRAYDLTMFCNGPWCDQSPRAIRNLLDAGYPAEKINYYRGGMQVWLSLGLTVQAPNA
jgi:rhodanese-related sulfurtransferase